MLDFDQQKKHGIIGGTSVDYCHEILKLKTLQRVEMLAEFHEPDAALEFANVVRGAPGFVCHGTCEDASDSVEVDTAAGLAPRLELPSWCSDASPPGYARTQQVWLRSRSGPQLRYPYRSRKLRQVRRGLALRAGRITGVLWGR